jgi:hypothetical protein
MSLLWIADFRLAGCKGIATGICWANRRLQQPSFLLLTKTKHNFPERRKHLERAKGWDARIASERALRDALKRVAAQAENETE